VALGERGVIVSHAAIRQWCPQIRRFLRQVVNGAGYEPRVVITDELASCPPPFRRVLPNTEHRRHKGI
jgi:transposase-like protein